MPIVDTSQILKAAILGLVLFVGGGPALAQTPTPSPTPSQPDALRPPGTETQSPTAAPGIQQPPPQAPPGTNVMPQSPTPPDQEPVAVPSPQGQEPRQPVFPTVSQKPLPPLPPLTRLGVTSDNSLALSINEAIRRALANNNDIEVARDDVRYAETQLRALRGIYEPVFTITPQIDKRIQPQQSTLGGSGNTGTVSNTVLSMNPTVSKAFEFGGGQYQVSLNNSRTESSSRFNFLNPFYAGNLGLTFTQPLLRNRSIDNNRRQIHIQRKRLEQSDADFRAKTINVINQVQRAYWDLSFALRDQQNQLANLNLSRENLRNTDAQIAAGAKAPLERAQVQTELANRETTLLQATQAVSIAENNLKQLILKDSSAPEWSAQITPTDTPAFDANPMILNDALKEARQNRPELQRLRLQRDINGIDLRYFKNQTQPQVDVQTTVATTGLAGAANTAALGPGQIIPPNLVGGEGQMLSNLFGFSTRVVVVGVAIQIPLRNKTAQANLAGSRIQQSQVEASLRAQDQLIEADVRNSAQAVETARKVVLSATEARKNAELQLEGEQKLYQVGRSTSFLLFQREDALTTARTQELRAQTDYNKALADLQRATSTTLHANNVIVETPTP